MGAAVLVAELHGSGKAVHERGAVGVETIEAARAQERLEHAAIDLLQVEPAAKILETLVGAVRLALCDQRLHGAAADAAHGAEPVADAVLAAGGELVARGVHIGREHRESHVAALLDEGHDFVGVVHVRREHGGHELRRVVRLEIRGLVGKQRVGRGM